VRFHQRLPGGAAGGGSATPGSGGVRERGGRGGGGAARASRGAGVRGQAGALLARGRRLRRAARESARNSRRGAGRSRSAPVAGTRTLERPRGSRSAAGRLARTIPEVAGLRVRRRRGMVLRAGFHRGGVRALAPDTPRGWAFERGSARE